jgi:membrane protease YdiL (CAAX protease family)
VPLLPALIAAVLAWSTVTDLWLSPRTGDGGYVVANLAATAVALTWARRAGLDAASLGLRRDTLPAGLTWGGAGAGAVVVVLALAVAAGDRLGPVALLLADERAALTGGALWFAVLVRIPIGTVVFEEVAFRGVLDAAAHRRLRPGPALALSAGVFGVYHLPPTLVALRLNDVAVLSPAGLGALAGAVVVTTVAGVLFSWARRRSGNLLAPVLLHLATNVGGLLAATAAQRGAG